MFWGQFWGDKSLETVLQKSRMWCPSGFYPGTSSVSFVCLNKILEKLIFSRMHKFCEDFNCIYEMQFGFWAKHSTNDALIDINGNAKSALDNKIHACGIFVDLQNAF